MRNHLYSIAAIAMFCCSPVEAKQITRSGVTAADIADMQRDCGADARKFCGGAGIAINAMERCLGRHVNQLSRACHDHIGPTDFRKYHKKFR